MGRLMIEGDYFFELTEEENPHEYMRDAFHGQMAKHSEYGEVQIRNTPELVGTMLDGGMQGMGTIGRT